MNDTPAAIYGTLVQMGYKVTPRGDRLQVVPDDIPPELLERLVRHRDGVLKLARMGERPEMGPEFYDGLKVFFPRLWDPVLLPDGEMGLLWGVTARGVLAHRFPTGPVITYMPGDVKLA